MEAIVRVTAIFFSLWVLTRGLGKRELTELTSFELLVLVTMGDLPAATAAEVDSLTIERKNGRREGRDAMIRKCVCVCVCVCACPR